MVDTQRQKLRTYVGVSVFTALAFAVCYLIRIPILFLTLDVKDAVITLTGLIFGPWAALFASAATTFLEFISVSDTGPWGLLMNFVASSAFSLTATCLYRAQRTQIGAAFSLVGAVFALVAVMIPLNLLVTPLYAGTTVSAVAALIFPILLPFNLAKGMLNATIVSVLYKPVVAALRRAGLIAKNEKAGFKIQKGTILQLSLSVLIALLAVIILVFLTK